LAGLADFYPGLLLGVRRKLNEPSDLIFSFTSKEKLSDFSFDLSETPETDIAGFLRIKLPTFMFTWGFVA